MKNKPPKKRILIADDDNISRQLVSRALEEAGYDVALAADGEEAVDTLARYGLDLVLTDLQMLGLDEHDRIDVLAHIHQTAPDIPVIIFTAHSDLGAEREAERLGARAYLNKPLNVEVMLAQISSVLSPHSD